MKGEKFMLRKRKSSAREAKEVGTADKIYLCGECVVAALKLTANGVGYHISYWLFAVWSSHTTAHADTTMFAHYALPVERSKLSGFSKSIRYLTELNI